jgi:hypothetical protein
MTYLELLQALEHRLGYQHLPLNPRASTLKNLFESSPVHHELMHGLAQALYERNTCCKLDDPVTRESCFEAIGSVRQGALKTSNTDVDAYHLLEDACHALDEIFPVDTAPKATEQKRTADVIPLAAARRRRRF